MSKISGEGVVTPATEHQASSKHGLYLFYCLFILSFSSVFRRESAHKQLGSLVSCRTIFEGKNCQHVWSHVFSPITFCVCFVDYDVVWRSNIFNEHICKVAKIFRLNVPAKHELIIILYLPRADTVGKTNEIHFQSYVYALK